LFSRVIIRFKYYFLCPGSDQEIFAVQKNHAVIADSFLDRQSFFPQLLSEVTGRFNGLPDGEDGTSLLKHVAGKTASAASQNDKISVKKIELVHFAA
jgi:hypothetical protein